MTNEEGLYPKQLLGPICILPITSTAPGVWEDEEETSPAFHQTFLMTALLHLSCSEVARVSERRSLL